MEALDLVVIYSWLAMNTLGMVLTLLLLRRQRTECREIARGLQRIDLHEGLNEVRALLQQNAIRNSDKLQRAVRNLLQSMRENSHLLEEKHWIAIRAIEELMP